MGVFAPDAGTAVEDDAERGVALDQPGGGDGGAGVTAVEDVVEFAGVTPGLARA